MWAWIDLNLIKRIVTLAYLKLQKLRSMFIPSQYTPNLYRLGTRTVSKVYFFLGYPIYYNVQYLQNLRFAD